MVDEVKKTFWQKVVNQFSSSNISSGWKIVRGIAGITFVVGGLLTGPACPIVFTATTLWWIGAVTTVSGVVAVGAQATNTKKE